jgi:hypothetical protein
MPGARYLDSCSPVSLSTDFFTDDAVKFTVLAALVAAIVHSEEKKHTNKKKTPKQRVRRTDGCVDRQGARRSAARESRFVYIAVL